jgi:Icc-related predicted phosphoesterase
MRLGRRKDDEGDRTVRLFYASDIHGSDLLWRKFLGATKFYEADAAVMGGDLLGKAIVPIERDADGTLHAEFLGQERTLHEGPELDELVGAIRFNGYYPWIGSREEIENRSADTEALFGEVARDEIRRWVGLAEERASANGSSKPYVMAGNDDPWFVDDILAGSQGVVFCDDQVVRVGPHEMISSSFANPTPWDSPRELDEEALFERLKKLADQLDDPGRAIFNLHVPPYDSRLDTGPDLKPDLTPRYSGGQPMMKPVGSHAVRKLIEEFQPLLALHGHIHESKGEVRIGRTLALNSGSEYNTGRLHGVVVTLGDERVVSHQFVVG